MSSYKILIADDHADAREGIRTILSSSPQYEIVGEAVNGQQAIEQADRLHPDLILMDIHMPGMDGLEATKRIKQANPATKIIILTVSEESTHLFDALKEGAQGYLLKSVRPTEWGSYMEAVLKDGDLSRDLIEQTLTKLTNKPSEKPPLSEREFEVMSLAAMGATNKEISKQLFITENTVKNHLKSVLRKLNIKNRVELARLAYEKHWL
ncbi:DNA-binding response regulator [Halobacillus andaensis]|uniref:DNA-binding response regulator n=1 Tax=Halobacillus andaensis TaxID=1176239 RepID=A0A917EWB3_HALAA|nr:response regulator transcription factor [Halobacillus andaensis]MBP2005983.1 DNA-binding NarL/FixJ family response regulator [Halobacillus andaensis]GGF24527.1 DNA-binding response regulator [Halobacillus andaensis]